MPDHCKDREKYNHESYRKNALFEQVEGKEFEMSAKNLKNRIRFLTDTSIRIGVAFILCLAMAVVGNADDRNVEPDQENFGVQEIEAVVVTAQKREENVQKVPISMEVFSDIELENAGIDNIKELTYFTPNLYSKQNTNQNMVFIRGISSHNVILNTSVGLFVDDINYPMSFMQNPDLVDIERVEILRGPQGTLYGRNTETGAIKIVTKQPDNSFEGKVFAETGIYDTPDDNPLFIKSGAGISGPVIEDKLYLGGAFQITESDGYTKNEYDGDDEAGKISHKTGKATLRWTPNDQTDISINANGYENDDGYGYVRYIEGPGRTDRYRINWDGGNRWEDKNYGQALKAKYSGTSFDLISITTHNEFETDFLNDGEFGPFTFPDQHFVFENRTVGQEIRILSPEEHRRVKWLFGVYGFRDDNEAKAEFFGMSRDTDFDNEGYALFGQTTFTFFDRVHLTAGLRYDHQKSDGKQKNNMLPDPYSADFEHNELLPKATVSVDLTNTTMGYVTVARGMMAGGFDYAFASSSDNLAFDPEFTWNYEAGAKTSWLDNRLQVNAALYYIDVKDKQVQEYLAGPAVRSITNAAKAYSRGMELDVQARPLPGLTLSGGLGISDAKIDEWVSDEETGGQYDYEDNYLTFAPKYTFNIGISYTLPSGYFARTDLLGVGDFYTDAKNIHKIDSYEIVNLSVGYQGDSFGVSLWCKNLFDEEYLTNKSEYVGGYTIVEDGKPRTIGTTITYRF